MSDALNPYAPPKHDGPDVTSGDPALEAIRREHINAETNVKTIGFLLYLGTFSLIVGAVRILELHPVDALVSIGLGVAMGWGGYWLRRLETRGRMAYTIITAIGMVRALFDSALAAAGAAIIAWSFIWPLILLAILWGKKASTVMSPHYRDVVIPATPHVKRQTSTAMIVLIILLLGVVVFFVALGMNS